MMNSCGSKKRDDDESLTSFPSTFIYSIVAAASAAAKGSRPVDGSSARVMPSFTTPPLSRGAARACRASSH